MKREIFAALALTVFSACGLVGSKSQEVADEGPKAVLTRSAKVVAGNVDQTEELTSEIIAFKENYIIPAASGVRISTILVDVGDNVKEGQVVATLDPTLYNQQMISVENLRSDYERLLPVYEAGGISRQTLDQAKVALDVQSEIAANLKKNIELLSPISGVVTARSAEAGDLFTNQAILHISQIDKVKVLAEISEMHFPSVKVGMSVDIRLDIYPDQVFKGRVSLIHPALDAATRTFTAEVTVPNASLKLRPGMYGRSTFNMGTKRGIMVPDVAVQKQFGSAENFVYVVEDEMAIRRRVEVGRKVGSQVDILSGVAVGEEVLVTAFSRLSDGAYVEIKNDVE
ncbi:MAG: efflux RND transporter periplasmic adaptor subunit [Rikenellaceae bacterium]